MSRHVEFITPENIEISYELAGIGSRFIAAVLDLLAQIGILIAMMMVGGTIASFFGGVGKVVGGDLSSWVLALLGLAVFCLIFGYHTFFEMRWNGQTPGKRVAKLRVVRDGGYPIDFYSSFVRNLVRWIDLMPPIYGLGLVSIFFSPEYKRLGDLAAGTLVIKESDPRFMGGRGQGAASPQAEYFLSRIRTVDGLTSEEYFAIRRFVERRHELEIPIQAHIAMRVALPIVDRLQIDFPIHIQWHYADLLEAIERKYVEERGIFRAELDFQKDEKENLAQV